MAGDEQDCSAASDTLTKALASHRSVGYCLITFTIREENAQRSMESPAKLRGALSFVLALSACHGDDRCGATLSPCALIGDGGALCVDTQSSWSHCGGCFLHCAVGQRCVAGRCVLPVCEANAVDCVDLFTRRECGRDGRNFATYECPADTVCAAGRCRTWPDDSAWSAVDHETFDAPPDLPDWLVSAGRCATIETSEDGAGRLTRFAGPFYARRALRFGEGQASAVSVRFRAISAPRAELAIFAMAGSASSGIAGGVRIRTEGSTMRVELANGALAYERAADGSTLTVRVEQDRARDRVRVLVDGRFAREAALSAFVLIGPYLHLRSDAACGEQSFAIEDVQTWSAP